MGQRDPDRRGGCELCEQHGGALVFQSARLRVVRVNDADHPGFYRVVWNDHVPEFSDLSRADRVHCMEAVATVEKLLREHLHPRKVNLASLGNLVAHLHWHVVARFDDDRHFPQPIWGVSQRSVAPEHWSDLIAQLPALDQAIGEALGQG